MTTATKPYYKLGSQVRVIEARSQGFLRNATGVVCDLTRSLTKPFPYVYFVWFPGLKLHAWLAEEQLQAEVEEVQPEPAPKPERSLNFYGVPPCGHFLLYLPESQANEQHFCYKCQKLVAMESEADHLQHVRQAEQERQERIKACAAELAALAQPEQSQEEPTECDCIRCQEVQP